MSKPTSFLQFVFLSHVVAEIGFFTSVLFGSIVIYLNVFVIQKVFGTYKYLMTAFTMLGMLFAVLEMGLCPNIHFYNAGLLFFTLDNPMNLSKETLELGLQVYGSLYSATISLLAVQFIYRYWVVFDDSKITKYFQSPGIYVWFFYCLTFGLKWLLCLKYFCNLDDVALDYFHQEMLHRYNTSVSSLPARVLLAYNSDGSVRWWNLSTSLGFSYIIMSQYSIMIYCGWQMHSNMEKRLSHCSAVFKKRNQQLLKTLMLQISTPTITLFSPIVVIVYAPIFNFHMSLPFGPVLCAFSLYPAMDALIVLTVMPEYKQAVKRGICNSLKAVWESEMVEVEIIPRTRIMKRTAAL